MIYDIILYIYNMHMYIIYLYYICDFIIYVHIYIYEHRLYTIELDLHLYTHKLVLWKKTRCFFSPFSKTGIFHCFSMCCSNVFKTPSCFHAFLLTSYEKGANKICVFRNIIYIYTHIYIHTRSWARRLSGSLSSSKSRKSY
jgi:hypothetical protein